MSTRAFSNFFRHSLSYFAGWGSLANIVIFDRKLITAQGPTNCYFVYLVVCKTIVNYPHIYLLIKELASTKFHLAFIHIKQIPFQAYAVFPTFNKITMDLLSF